ncbi:MAG TPA: hypothetical protein VGA78_00270 [Gemmatimonadales bacterium]|jgi:hypothetical protein
MVLPALLILLLVAFGLLYGQLRQRPDRRSLWRGALRIGLGVGVARAVLASLGWYVVEHDGGPLQIPGFALAMAAWPEAVILSERRVTPVPPAFYGSLSLLLIASTMILVGLVAVVVEFTRTNSRQPRS